MEVLIILVIVAIVAVFIFVNIKIRGLKERATQHILKNSGISSSDINAGITETMEKKHLQNFLNEHQNFTEQSIKDLLKNYTNQLFNKNLINEFSPEIAKKMQSDSKLDKMKNIEFRRINISNYGNSKLIAIAVYTDNRDEYNVYLTCSILGEKIQLDNYRIAKGSMVGF